MVSCVCTKCYHHFRIKVAAGSDVPFGKHHALNMHMFIMSGRDSDMLLKATRDAHDHIIDRTYLICLVDECRCRIEFERLPPRLSTRELDALGDKQRIVRNMREAQSKDAERVKSLGEGFSPNVFEMLKTYLNDGLTADVNAPPRRIKTHNKRFMVAINNDFDDLWRTLGFEKTIVEDGDEAWVFAKLEPPSSPTAFGTLRAKWEDTEAECMLHLDSIPTGPRKIRPAWEMLQRVFGCEKYESTLGTPVRDAADLAILGCLANFKATLYSMAAVLLAEKCPLRWEEFKGAALRLSNDDQEASEALALYESTLDSSPQQYMSDEVDAAYQFFGAHHKERDGDFFIARYYMMLDADSSEGNVKRLQSNIDIVGNFLSKDLVSVVRPESDTSKMDLIRAGSILNDADMTYTEDIMESIVNNKVSREKLPIRKIMVLTFLLGSRCDD